MARDAERERLPVCARPAGVDLDLVARCNLGPPAFRMRPHLASCGEDGDEPRRHEVPTRVGLMHEASTEARAVGARTSSGSSALTARE
jgi:hypothetical protein